MAFLAETPWGGGGLEELTKRINAGGIPSFPPGQEIFRIKNHPWKNGRKWKKWMSFCSFWENEWKNCMLFLKCESIIKNTFYFSKVFFSQDNIPPIPLVDTRMPLVSRTWYHWHRIPSAKGHTPPGGGNQGSRTPLPNPSSPSCT